MYNQSVRILILGASGMLGHTLLFVLPQYGFNVCGTVRCAKSVPKSLTNFDNVSLISGVDAYNLESIRNAIEMYAPDMVINCVGVVRQRAEGRNKKICIDINARLPHTLFDICQSTCCRIVHFSSDCVFDGREGKAPYGEEDCPSAHDVYGMSKFLGELDVAPALTLRTSVIGHELSTQYSFLEWFLHAKGTVRGYSRAIFSGLPACEHARILAEYVVPHKNLHGLFHVAGSPISKFELLKLIAEVYAKDIKIIEDASVVENKTLAADAFCSTTGYVYPPWETLIATMKSTHESFLGIVS